MDIELLRTFITVTRVRHFGKAAEQLCITPAAVSARIRQLEQMLGVSLLERIRGNIQMTPAGEKLLPHARHLLDAWTLAQADLNQVYPRPAPLKLGYSTCLNLLLADWLVDTQSNILFPGSLLGDTNTRLQIAVEQGRLDAALITTSSPHEQLRLLPLGNIQLVFAVSSVVADRWIQLDWGQPTPAPQDWQQRQSLTCQDGILARQLWQSGGGGLWLPQELALSELKNHRASQLLELADSSPELSLYLACRADKEEELRPLIQHISGKLAKEN